MWSLSLVMSECSLSGRVQGHVSNFYIVDLENFATASRRYTGDMHNSTVVGFYDTYKTKKATRTRHGWVHMFITHRPTLTLKLHDLDLFRTCRTSSFCTVAWQLARFQLTRRIARSLGDSWASCCIMFRVAVVWLTGNATVQTSLTRQTKHRNVIQRRVQLNGPTVSRIFKTGVTPAILSRDFVARLNRAIKSQHATVQLRAATLSRNS